MICSIPSSFEPPAQRILGSVSHVGQHLDAWLREQDALEKVWAPEKRWLIFAFLTGFHGLLREPLCASFAPDPRMLKVLGTPSAALGFVVDDPDATARLVALQLQRRGFTAVSIHDAEPGLPIAFVRTDALSGSVLVFRKHMLRMGAKPDAWTARTTSVD